MTDTAEQQSTPKAPKDKNCPFCGQAFTSSSLGRHLDLYVKEKNPRPPDGIHDVEEIRKIRGGITRRHPRNSLARRETLTPVGTPNTTTRKSPGSDAESSTKSPVLPRSAHGSVTNLNLSGPRWEGSTAASTDAAPDSAKRSVPTRAMSRQMVKAQFEMKQKFQDAIDTSKAAELALREIIGSWRAAKTNVDINSMPFDFDPLSLDFPALTLQCLKKPPTLFSSTQHPTATSWSISPPGQRQFEALTAFFRDEFMKYKTKCIAAATAAEEDLGYPAQLKLSQPDPKEAAKRAEKAVESLEEQVTEHLQSAYSVWTSLDQQRQSELWVLELARIVGRGQTELEKLKEAQQTLRQENAKLKTQLEQLGRLQQSRDSRIVSPTTIPMKEAMIEYLEEQRVNHGRVGVALKVDDGRSDLSTVVAKSIEKWKTVIVNARAANNSLSSQRTLDAGSGPLSPALVTGGSQASQSQSVISAPDTAHTTQTQQSRPQQQQQQPPPPSPLETPTQQSRPQQQQQPPPPSPLETPTQQHHKPVPTLQQAPKGRNLGTTATASQPRASQPTVVSQTSSVPVTTSVASTDDAGSDLDADAEMEDDDEGYAAMNTPASRPLQTMSIAANPPQPSHESDGIKLEVPRTRGPAQRVAVGSPYARSVSHAAPSNGRARGAQMSNRSATNFIPAVPRNQEADPNTMPPFTTQAELGIPVPDMSGDPMYMD
ncbi:hypothetical protein PpBr36_03335 [Pyricularia pennisetigena]|uniref:hypothetical protein n=1 Tax=Pyricularia pennisetigena TaxID=1578925 RepID=UPI001153D514|nr:hypothetical protein PpBr36_03335 [Pyricularia pennisetigena]TLS30018.1 hypothetical protein PpBr36_03335 [Pyricularia pennisetigena]